jgi:predicted small lipoprotein YifL
MRHQLLALLLLTLGLAACGQKGGLYIPQQDPAPPAQTSGE